VFQYMLWDSLVSPDSLLVENNFKTLAVNTFFIYQNIIQGTVIT